MVSLGSASFELIADNSQLTAAFVQAKASAENASSAIAAATRTQAAAIRESNAVIKAALQETATAQTATAQAAVKSSAQATAAYQQQANAAKGAAAAASSVAQQSTPAFVNLSKSALAAGAAFAGVTLGAAGAKQALEAVTVATLKAEQAQRTLAATYGSSAPQFTAFADAQAKAFGRTNTEVEQGVSRLAVLQKQYGITGDEIQKLTRIALNLGATFGDTAEAFRSVEGAIRGEPEALEKYGIALQQNAIQNSDLLTESQKKNFASLDAVTQARLRYQIILQKSAQFEGAAAERANSSQGAFDRLTRATDEAAKSIGQRFVPALAKAASAAADYVEGSKSVTARNSELAASFEEFARRYTAALGPLSAIGLFDLLTGKGQPKVPTTPTPFLPGPVFGPSPGEVTSAIDRAVAAEKAREDAIAEVRKDARAHEAKAGEQAAQDEHDREAKALDDKKVLLEVERDAKLKAVEAQKDAAIKGIEDEAKAAADASEAQIAGLHAQQQAAERAAADRHDAEVAGIEATSKAAADAVAENIRNLEIERDRAKDASEAKRDAAIKALDDEKTAREAARTAEDRAEDDRLTASKRREDERHQTAVQGYEDETKAANDSKEQQLRNLDALAKKQQDRHEQRLRHLADEADAIRDQHDAAVKGIEDTGKAASDAHEARLRALDDEAQAARDAAEMVTKALDAAYEIQSRRREEEHAQTLKALDEEAIAVRDAAADAAHEREAQHEAEMRALDQRHQDAVRGFEVEADAARAAAETADRARDAAHERTLRDLDSEAEAARTKHDEVLAGIDAEKRAEDDRHRAALSAIDQEERRRLDAIDKQLGILDAADEADRRAAKDRQQQEAVVNARFGLQKAESTGNLSEIVKARQTLEDALAAITDEGVKRERDAARATLKAQQDAIKAEADTKKQAEDEADRRRQREIGDAKDAADQTLKAQLDAIDARKQAENDAYAAAKLAAKDALDAVLRGIDARKTAEADQYAKTKQAAEDAYKAISDQAAAALKVQLDAIEKRKQAEQDQYAKAKQVAQDAYDAQKQAAKDALDAQLRAIDARKRAEQDVFQAGQDRRTREKDALDAQLKTALDRIDAEKRAEDDAYAKTKDRLDKRKTAIADANKDELDKIAARKQAENDAHDNAVTKAQDQATQEKRAIQDRRTAEDLADKAKREQIQLAFENEARDRKARYDDQATGEIPALQRALHAAQETFRQRKEAADVAYAAEQRQIQDLYTHPEKGLIPLAQKAAAAVAASFQAQTRTVNEEAKKQSDAINAQYTNPAKTGLLDLLERARADSQDKLDKQRQYWQAWAEDIGGPNGQIKKVIGRFDELINKIKEAGGTVTVGGPQPVQPGNQGPPGQGSGPAGGGGVPSPYRVTFPFDAPYNGPYPGGAAWPGGPPRHRGVDLALPGPDNGRGTPYGAFQPGTVESLIPVSQDPAGGNGILIRTDEGLYNYYGHNERFLVHPGQHVEAGELIGVLGRSGLEQGLQTHLHYEVRRGINGDPVGSTINPVPYMQGGTVGEAGGQTFEFDLFGRHFVFKLPFGTAPSGEVGKWIAAALKEAKLPDDWLLPMEQITAAESGTRNPDGSVQIGTGSADPPHNNAARGLMQMLPETFKRNRLASLPDDIYNPIANAASSGRYIKSQYGDPRNTLYFRTGEFDWRGVPGYRDGVTIDRPTLLVNPATMRVDGMAGEAGPERLLGALETQRMAAGGGAGGPVNSYTVPITFGSQVVETLVFEGISLNVRRGSLQEIRR